MEQIKLLGAGQQVGFLFLLLLLAKYNNAEADKAAQLYMLFCTNISLLLM